MSAALERRAGLARSRAAVRAWEYRQRRHAKGVWFRLRRVLTGAEMAFAISDDDAAALITEGFSADPVGAELQPPRMIVAVPRTRAERIPSRRPLAVRLDAEMLAARAVVVVRFGNGG